MLHQIELHRIIPQLRAEIHGFIDESQAHIADSVEAEQRLKSKFPKKLQQSTHFIQAVAKERSTRGKYSHRVKCCNHTLESIKELQRCLNE